VKASTARAENANNKNKNVSKEGQLTKGTKSLQNPLTALALVT
jgi:hypothetical protein